VQFLPPQQQQSSAASMLAGLGAVGGLASAAAGIKNPSDQYVAFIKSESIKDALIERFDLMQRFKTKLKVDARTTLDGMVMVNAGVKDGLISLEVSDREPAFAAELANAYPEELQKLLSRLAVTEAQQRRLFFERQLGKVKDSLIEAERELRRTGVSDSDLKVSPTSAVATVAALKAQVTAKEVQLGAMRGYLAPTAPEYRQALTELSALRTQLQRQSEQDGQSLSSISTQTSAASQKVDDYVSRYREFKYQEALFDLLSKQFEAARVDEAREGAVIQVLDAAQTPERKSKPKRALMAIIATLATGFALVLWIFARQALINAKGDQETAQKLTRLSNAWNEQAGPLIKLYRIGNALIKRMRRRQV
jgi:capsule polysaccharide export protein KpsE/RkpR